MYMNMPNSETTKNDMAAYSATCGIDTSSFKILSIFDDECSVITIKRKISDLKWSEDWILSFLQRSDQQPFFCD